MKKIFSIAALALAVSTAHAAPVYQPAGPNLTYGNSSNGQRIMSDATNPSASAVSLDRKGDFTRFGLLTNIGIGLEYGQVDNIFDVIDEKSTAYTDGLNVTLPTLPADPTNTAQVNQFINDVQQVIDVPVGDLNSVLAVVARDGYAKAFGSASLPLMPVVVGRAALGGALTFDVSSSVATKAVGLYDSINVDYSSVQNQLLTWNGTDSLDLGEVSLDLNAQTLTVNNDTTLLTRAAGMGEIALGYSRQMMKRESGGLFGGVRAKYYRVGLTQVATRLGDLTDAEQLFQDIRDAAFFYDTNFGVDLGVLWVSEHYQLGATIADINEPSFTFPGLDVSTYSSGSIANRLAQDYVYTLKRQYKLEGALFSSNRRWVLNATFDANAAPDPFGDDYQWATVSGSYFTDSWLIPGVRAGYRSNLAGEEMNYVTLGLTLFKMLNVDGAMALNDVTIDGTTVPRGVMLNLGLEMPF